MWYLVFLKGGGAWLPLCRIFAERPSGVVAAYLQTWEAGPNSPQQTTPEGMPPGVHFYEWGGCEFLALLDGRQGTPEELKAARGDPEPLPEVEPPEIWPKTAVKEPRRYCKKQKK